MSSQSSTTKAPAPKPAHRGSKRVTLKDLAEHLGLSAATVSRALSGSPQADALAPETRRRVEEAARELNYRPNYLARSLRGKRTFSIGVLVPEISEGYTAGLLSGVEVLLSDQGFRYLMVSHHSRARVLDEDLDMLLDRGVEGLILIAVQLRRELPVPAVVLSGTGRNGGDVDRVMLDHDRAAELALGHLQELGHRRIAFFRGQSGNVDSDDRWRAIREKAAELDLAVDPELALRLKGAAYGETFTAEGGYREGYRYGQKLLDAGRSFTALFAFNDISAIGAMRAFQDAGLKVPGDVSVIGFDDIQSAAFHRPSLTTVRQPLRRMGETATRLLLDRLGDTGGSSAVKHVILEPQLVARESTGPSPKNPWSSAELKLQA